MTSPFITSLVVTIALLLYVIFEVINLFRLKTRINLIPLILFILGVLFTIFIAYQGGDLNAGDLAQTLLTLGLVAVTAVYAWATQRQADANINMAKEMKNQRYDAVRPIIDIQKIIVGNRDRALEVLAATEGKTDICLSCKLKNIGLGPAIDVYSFTQLSSGEKRRQEHGTLAIGEEISYVSLLIEHKDSSMELAVFFRDTYGRKLKSFRPVTLNLENQRFVLGPLKIQELSEEKP